MCNAKTGGSMKEFKGEDDIMTRLDKMKAQGKTKDKKKYDCSKPRHKKQCNTKWRMG